MRTDKEPDSRKQSHRRRPCGAAGRIAPVLRLLITGEAGEGILTAGTILFEAGAAAGFEASLLTSVPANIRGGVAHALVSFCPEPIASPSDHFEILVALSKAAFLLFRDDLRPGNHLIIDCEIARHPGMRRSLTSLARSGIRIDETPLTDIARRFVGSPGSRNMAALGISSGLLRLAPRLFRERIRRRLGPKDGTIAESGLAAFEAGREWAMLNLGESPPPFHARRRRSGRAILEGNEAVALGALAAGCSFYASYPITPATSIGNIIGRLLSLTGGVSLQSEDEIGALGAALGASFSGVKAMTATSGPGLSLMQELIGYATMAEIPVVIVDVQRAGPSTGMPTKHEQSDLMAAALGSHGEGPRIVVSPISVEGAFYLTVDAFNLAEQYQCPVIVLSDAAFASIKTTLRRPDPASLVIAPRAIMAAKAPAADYRRYEPALPGERPLAVPGVSPVTYCATGVEHDYDSSPVAVPLVRERRMRERFAKLDGLEDRTGHLVEWDLGDLEEGDEAHLSVAAWGLTAWIVKLAVRRLRSKGYRIAALYPQLLFPVCADALHRLSRFCDKVIIAEANFSGQYASLVRMHTTLRPHHCGVYGGEPFTSDELERRLLRAIGTRGKR